MPEETVPRRVLLIRLSAAGDIVMASLVARALKTRWPDCHIDWLCEPAYACLPAANIHVDEVITFNKTEWVRLLRSGSLWRLGHEAAGLRRQLKNHAYDLVIDLQGLFKSGMLAGLSAGTTRIGLGSREGSARFMTTVLPRDSSSGAIGAEYRALAEHLELGLDADDFQVRLFTAADLEAATRLLDARGITRPMVAICPFTTRPQKHWFTEHWTALIRGLRARCGGEVVIMGGPGDRAAASAIPASGVAVQSLVGDTTLSEAAAVISRSALVIGVDTGLTHMGMLSATPTFVLFGSTVPYRRAPKPADHIFYKALPCSPCRRHPTCGQRFDCMRDIGSAEVLDRAAALLGCRP